MAELSAAQIEQRRNAALSRWRERAEMGTAGVAGAVAARIGTKLIFDKPKANARDRVRAAARKIVQPTRSAFRQTDRLDAFSAAFEQKVRGEAGAGHANLIAILGRRKAAHERRAQNIRDVINHHHLMRLTDPDQADPDFSVPNHEAMHERETLAAKEAQDKIDTLKASAARPKKIKRRAHKKTIHKETFIRPGRVKPRAVYWDDTSRSLAAAFLKQDPHFFGEHYANIDELTAAIENSRHVADAVKDRMGQYAPKIQRWQPKHEVRNRAKSVSEHTTKNPHKLARADINRFKSDERLDHGDRLDSLREEILGRWKERLAQSRADYGPELKRAAVRLARLKMIERGALRVVPVAGLLAGAFAARAYEQHRHPAEPVAKYSQNYSKAGDELAKTDGNPPEKPKRRKKAAQNVGDLFAHAADTMRDAAEAGTEKLASGIAGAFAAWKDAATDEAIASANQPGGLLDQLGEPLERGMAHLDDATREGLTTPTHVASDGGDDGGRSHIIRFGFDLRDPGSETFIKKYRIDRVKELTDEQRRNVTEIITHATMSGAAPQTTARKIRDVIGLTSYQAGIVSNYRAQLETLDPRALGYELRDHRFDSTVRKAIDSKTPLSAEQVNRMVDAYSRRFLAYRAMTIARTEALSAANNAHIFRVQRMLDDDPSLECVKTWMATEDERTRPDHRGLNRKTVVGLQTPFVCDSGETIRWPHDPKAAAKEIVRCRCVLMTMLVPRGNVHPANMHGFTNPYPDFWTKPTKETTREPTRASA